MGILQGLGFAGSALFLRASRLDGSRVCGCMEVQDVASVLTLPVSYNQTLCAMVQCDVISDILTCSYVIGHKLSPLSFASSPHCTSGSRTSVCCRSTSPDVVLCGKKYFQS